MKQCRWEFAAAEESAINVIAGTLSTSRLFARCVVNRGCADPEAAQLYFEPRLSRLSDPFLLPGMERAVERLLRAQQEKEAVVIFGDYDVDGVTAAALLKEFFETFGWSCHCYLPHRLDEGYGLSREAVFNCLERYPVKLILAVDCGSTSVEVIRELAERGVEVVVLDHHQVPRPAPPCHALVNPQLLEPGHPLQALCSAGLAFKLAHALLKQIRLAGWPGADEYDLREALDLVALGTIADIVPLTGENRILARSGLRRLANSSRQGINALKRVAGLGEAKQIGPYEVGFQLAPRLNAAGRLETALDALELLLTEDASRAGSLAAALNEQNQKRQALEQEVLEKALAAVRARFVPERDYVIIEGDATWHIGVVGIVASRILREFNRPVVIFGGDGSDEWRGSGRSIQEFDLAGGLRECSDLLLKHGGHAMAAGVTLAPVNLADFRTRLNELARARLAPEAFHPRLRLDGIVELRELTFAFVQSLEGLHPFGHSNPPVHLAARGLVLAGERRRFGTGERHLRFAVSDGTATHQALWWSCPPDTEFPPRFDLAFAPELNEFNGTYAIQLKVLDLRESDE